MYYFTNFSGGLLSTNASSGYVKVRVDLQAADAITEFCIKFPNGNEIEAAPLKTANAKQVNIIGLTKWLLT